MRLTINNQVNTVGSSEWYNNVCEPGHKILDLHLLLLHLVTWISCSRITSGMHAIVWEPSLAAEDEGKFYYQARSYLSNLRENIGYSYQRYRWTKSYRWTRRPWPFWIALTSFQAFLPKNRLRIGYTSITFVYDLNDIICFRLLRCDCVDKTSILVRQLWVAQSTGRNFETFWNAQVQTLHLESVWMQLGYYTLSHATFTSIPLTKATHCVVTRMQQVRK